MIIVGLYRVCTGTLVVQNPVDTSGGLPAVSLFLLLRAFASGSTALTGVEAISNGVPAFKRPEIENAIKTLWWMAVLLAFLFVGITYLAFAAKIVPNQTETVISQLAKAVFGTGFFYFVVQISTSLILLLATNTSFAGFPRLASIMARDGYFPRQFGLVGDRLVYNNGIVFLAIITSVVVIIFEGNTHDLIPLYAVGVFLTFTLSQAGMVARWRKTPGNHKKSILINATGTLITAVVFLVILVTKLPQGTWVVPVFIFLMVKVLNTVHQHYTQLAETLRITRENAPAYKTAKDFSQLVVVPIASVNKSVANSIRYAKTISDNVLAVHVATNMETAEKTKMHWEEMEWDVPLKILESPYRSLYSPMMSFLKQTRQELNKQDPEALIVVIVPEFVYHRWWEYLLHSETAIQLKILLRFEPNIVVCSVPFHVSLKQV